MPRSLVLVRLVGALLAIILGWLYAGGYLLELLTYVGPSVGWNVGRVVPVLRGPAAVLSVILLFLLFIVVLGLAGAVVATLLYRLGAKIRSATG